jgi:branched-chain amino acid aminotransferase
MIETKLNKIRESRLPVVNFNDLGFGRIFSDHQFIADFENGKWQNFRIEPYGPLQITPANATLHYAQAIFEGMKAFRKDDEILIFRPDLNWERLNKSAERMCIPQLPKEIFMDGLSELLKIDKEWIPNVEGGSLYLRPFIFASEEFLGVRPANSYKFIIITSPVGAYYNAPVKVKIEKSFARVAPGGMGAAKTAGNYAASLYPAYKAKEQGFDQLIWTDAVTHELVEESGTMNLFFVIDDVICTPELSSSILDGVTRRSLIALARALGYRIEESPLKVDKILDACRNGKMQEAFGAGTAATISPISHISYENELFELPKVETREISKKLFELMDGIKRGTIPDTNNWNFKIKV